MATTLETLPDEVLGEIFSYFESATFLPPPHWSLPKDGTATPASTSTLFNLSLVSKRISKLSQPSLYRKIVFKDNTRKLDDQDAQACALDFMLAGGNNARFKHARELEIRLFDVTEEVASLLLSNFGNVTRLKLRLSSGMGKVLAGIAASMQSLQRLAISAYDVDDQTDEAQIFLSQLLLLDKERRLAGGHVVRLATLEVRLAELGDMSSELAAVAVHYEISALSFWECQFEGFDFQLLHLSIDSDGLDYEIDLGGIDRLAYLHHLRIGQMHLRNPEVFIHPIPPQVRTLQIMFPNHGTLTDIISGFGLGHLPNLSHFEVQGMENLVGSTKSQFRRLGLREPSKAEYAAYCSSFSEALDYLRVRNVTVIPTNLLEIMERCGTESWGEEWRQAAEYIQEYIQAVDNGQVSEAGSGDDEEGVEV